MSVAGGMVIPVAVLVGKAQAAAFAHGLEPAVVCGQAERESAWNPWSIRYEEGFYERYVMPLVNSGKVLDPTEAHARAMSWGLGQVMGQTAREFGYAGELAMLCDPATGLEWQCRVLAHKIGVNGGNIEAGLAAYNGGANPNYAAEVLRLAQKYR